MRICQSSRTRSRAPAYPRCTLCGAPHGTGLPEDRVCPEYFDWPPGLVSGRCAVVLTSLANSLAHALKYGGWTGLAEDLADRMVRDVGGSLGLDERVRLVPVPTTPGRLRGRGYNQARKLACGVAARVGGQVVDVLERIQEGVSQVSLARTERRNNVDGVFSLRAGAESWVGGQHLVLVDDVLTTGATACAAATATALRDGGAETVQLLAFARALAENH